MKKIKSRLLIIFILFFGICVSVFILVSRQLILYSDASPGELPKDIKITNISDNSFSVSWLTPYKMTVGFVEFGTDNNFGNIAIDDRDNLEQSAKLTHHVTIKNLLPSQKYFFQIVSDTKKFDNSGSPFLVSTASVSNLTPPLPLTTFGKIAPSSSDILVYLSIENSSQLSTYTRKDGNWLITLNNARNLSSDEYIKVEPDSVVSLTVTDGQNLFQKSNIVKNMSPAGDIALGDNLKKSENNMDSSASVSTETGVTSGLSSKSSFLNKVGYNIFYTVNSITMKVREVFSVNKK